MPTLTTIAIDRSALPVALAELAVVDQVEPDRARHDREAEDRVREVVQGPRGRDGGAARRGQPGEPTGASARDRVTGRRWPSRR